MNTYQVKEETAIAFKTSESISNEVIFSTLLIVLILMVGAFYLIKYLKEKGFGMIKSKSNVLINIIEKRQVSASTQIQIIQVGQEQFLLVESRHHIALQPNIMSDCLTSEKANTLDVKPERAKIVPLNQENKAASSE